MHHRPIGSYQLSASGLTHSCANSVALEQDRHQVKVSNKNNIQFANALPLLRTTGERRQHTTINQGAAIVPRHDPCHLPT
mmetsp:Transcript_9013/g.15687  ORF Transcript_9013/g.15687 Transcript_9013/m.15687 type:complete len:80 (+) Transcript_9013:279-518(+)